MLRSEVLDTTRYFMMADEQTDPRAVKGRSRPMSRELMLQTLDGNHPRWQQTVGLEKEVGEIITKALKKHRME